MQSWYKNLSNKIDVAPYIPEIIESEMKKEEMGVYQIDHLFFF